jgi:hypothetical protein
LFKSLIPIEQQQQQPTTKHETQFFSPCREDLINWPSSIISPVTHFFFYFFAFNLSAKREKLWNLFKEANEKLLYIFSYFISSYYTSYIIGRRKEVKKIFISQSFNRSTEDNDNGCCIHIVLLWIYDFEPEWLSIDVGRGCWASPSYTWTQKL